MNSAFFKVIYIYIYNPVPLKNGILEGGGVRNSIYICISFFLKVLAVFCQNLGDYIYIYIRFQQIFMLILVYIYIYICT